MNLAKMETSDLIEIYKKVKEFLTYLEKQKKEVENDK